MLNLKIKHSKVKVGEIVWDTHMYYTSNWEWTSHIPAVEHVAGMKKWLLGEYGNTDYVKSPTEHGGIVKAPNK